jgi:hypothetical protein
MLLLHGLLLEAFNVSLPVAGILEDGPWGIPGAFLLRNTGCGIYGVWEHGEGKDGLGDSSLWEPPVIL